MGWPGSLKIAEIVPFLGFVAANPRPGGEAIAAFASS